MDQGDDDGPELSVAEIAQLLDNMNNRAVELEVKKEIVLLIHVFASLLIILNWAGSHLHINCPFVSVELFLFC